MAPQASEVSPHAPASVQSRPSSVAVHNLTSEDRAALANEARLRGNSAFSQGRWDSAVSIYTAALDLSPVKDARLFSNRSAAYLAKHREVMATLAASSVSSDHITAVTPPSPAFVASAIRDATAATAARPDWVDGWYRLFAASVEGGFPQQARRALETGIGKCPNPQLLRDALHSHLAEEAKLESEVGNHDVSVVDSGGDTAAAVAAAAVCMRQADGSTALRLTQEEGSGTKGSRLARNGQDVSSAQKKSPGEHWSKLSESQRAASVEKEHVAQRAPSNTATVAHSVPFLSSRDGIGRVGAKENSLPTALPCKVDEGVDEDSSVENLSRSEGSLLNGTGKAQNSMSSRGWLAVDRDDEREGNGEEAVRESRVCVGEAQSSAQTDKLLGSPPRRSVIRISVPNEEKDCNGKTEDSVVAPTTENVPVPNERAPDRVVPGTSPVEPVLPQRPAAGSSPARMMALPEAGNTAKTRSGPGGRSAAADAVRLRANDRFRSGDWDSAIAGYTRSLALARADGAATDRRALSNRSAAWLRKAIETDNPECFAAALRDAESCIELDGNWAKAWFRKGSALLEDGRPGEARSVLLEGLRRCPGDKNLANTLVHADAVIAAEGAESIADEEEAGPGFVGEPGSPAEGARGQAQDAGKDEVIGAKPSRSSKSNGKDTFASQAENIEDLSPGSTESIVLGSAATFSPVLLVSGADLNQVGKRSSDSEAVRLSRQAKGTEWMERSTASDVTGSSAGQSPSVPRRILSSFSSMARRRQDETSSETRSQEEGDGGSARESGEMLRSFTRDSGMTERDKSRKAASRKPESVGVTEDERGSSSRDSRSPSNAGSGYADSRTRTLYEVLNVTPDASEAVIRRSYYLAARELHPDKNPDDPNATYKFQQVSEAYQVLSNPESRALYDSHGEAGLEKGGIDVVDPQTLFAIVFGSDQFADFIGSLKLTTLAANVGEDGEAPSQECLDTLQKERIEKLTRKLVANLRPWIRGDREEFLSWAELEGERLSDTNFGSDLLATIGSVYVYRVDIFMGKGQLFGFKGIVRDASYRTHKLGAQIKANAATNKVMLKQKKLHDRMVKLNREGTSISETEAQNVAAEMARNAVDMMWKISVLDIQSTLEAVIERVLSADDVSADVDVEAYTDAEFGSGELKYNRRTSDEPFEGLTTGLSTKVAGSARSWVVSQRASGIRALGKKLLAASRRKPSHNGGLGS